MKKKRPDEDQTFFQKPRERNYFLRNENRTETATVEARKRTD